MEDQVRFMRRAIELAVENVRLKRGGPFGAVVVKNGQIIAEGTNLVTTTNDPTAHAEVVSIRQACAALKNFQLDGCDLYTSCEPCPMCLGAIYWARAERVFYGGTHKDAAAYGFDDSFIYQQMRLPVDQRQIPMKQLLGEEALEGFLEWRRSAEKVLY
jgi:tRNA(Arg) A34 adenosine deaminase TadA